MAAPVENITVLPPEPKRGAPAQPPPQKSFADILQEEDRGDETDRFTDPWEDLSAHLAEVAEVKEPLPDLPAFEVTAEADLATGYSPIGHATGSANTTAARGRVLDVTV